MLGAAFADAGIGPDTLVLAFDDGTGWAARCWWLLRHLGHEACGTVDMRAYTGPLVTEAPRVDRAPFARVRDDDTIDAEEIRARLDDPRSLVDARSPERWRGDTEPLDPVAGRIPGARNAFFELAAARRRDGAARGRRVLRLGRDSVRRRAAARLAGREDVRLYPGSFSEWCRNPSNPIERGDRDDSVRQPVRPRAAERRADRRPRPPERARC